MPTQADLQREIAGKLKDQTAKVNVKVHVEPDGNSLRSLRRKISDFTKGKPVKIKTELDTKGLSSQINALNRSFEKLKNSARGTGKALSSGVASSAGFRGTKEQLNQVNAKVKAIIRSEKEWRSLNTKVQGGNMGSKQLDVTKRRMDQLKSSIKSAHRELTSMTGSASTSNSLLASMRGAAGATDKFKAKLAGAKNEERQASSAAKQLASSIKQEFSMQKQMLSAGTREKAILNEQLSLTRKQTNEIARQAKMQESATRQRAANATRIAQIEARAADKQTAAQQRATASASKQSASGLHANKTFDLFNMAQQGGYAVAALVGQMNEVDKAITSVTKVVDAPKAAVDSFADNIYKNATKVGKSASEYASAVEQWASAGYNLKQSTALAKDSVMGAFVGNVDVNDMVKYMAVPLNAFRKQGLKSKDVINAMNEVANKNAIEMDDLGQAYSKAGASVASTGTNFSQLTGMVTAAQEGTRAGGDVIGRAIKTISVNFSNMGNGLTKQNKVRSAYFKNLGVDLKDSNGKLKSTWSIMDKLAGKWKTMSKSDKQTASWYAAGKEQATQFQAMMDNWKTAKKAAGEAQGQVDLVNKSQGSAFKEFAKQQDSMEFHLAALKNAWGQLMSTLSGGRDGLNGIIDAGKGVLDVLNNIAGNKIIMGGIKTVGLAVGFVAARKALSGFIGMLSRVSLGHIKSEFSTLKTLPNVIKSATSEMKSLKGASDLTVKSLSSGLKFASTKKTSNAYMNSRSKTVSRDALMNASANLRSGSELSTLEHGAVKITSVGSAAVGAARGASLFSKALTGAKIAGRGLLAALGPIGAAIDIITLALAALKLMGIDPIKDIKNAAHAGEIELKNMSKELNTLNNANLKLGKSISKNPVFNGDAIKSNKKLSSITSDFNKLTPKNNKIDDSSFQKIKSEYNSIAKKNGIDLRIRFNNYDLIKAQLANLKGQLRDVNRTKLDIGTKQVTKELQNMGKIGSKNNINKLLSSFNGSKVSDKLDQAYYARQSLAQIKQQHAGGQLDDGVYKRKVAEIKAQIKDLENTQLRGTNLAKTWSSKQGQQITEAWNNVSTNIRKQMTGLGKSLDSGMFDSSDFSSMSKGQLQQMTVAQGQVLHQYSNQKDMLNDINDVRKKGGKLTAEQLTFLASQGKQYQNLTADTRQWSSSQASAVGKLGGKLNENKKAAEEQLKTILMTNGMSASSAEETAAAYAKSGKAYVQQLEKQGKLGQAMLGVTQEFKSAYGSGWKKDLADLQGQIDKIPEEKKTKYSFSDENGMIIPGVIDKINEIPKKKLTELGVVDKKSGNFSITKFSKGLKGIPKEKLVKAGVVNAEGSVDPVKFLKEVMDLKSGFPNELRVRYLANTTDFSNKTKQAIMQMDKIDGKEATAKYIADNNLFGKKTQAVLDWLDDVDGTEATAKVKLDTENALSRADKLKGELKELAGSDYEIRAELDNGSLETQVSSAIDEVHTLEKLRPKLKVDGDKKKLDDKIAAIKSQLHNIKDKVINVNGGGDADSKTKKIEDMINALDGKTANTTVNTKLNGVTVKQAQDKAHKSGTAFADAFKENARAVNDMEMDPSKGNQKRVKAAGAKLGKAFKQAFSDASTVAEQKTKNYSKKGGLAGSLKSALGKLFGGNKTKIKISVSGSKDASVKQLVSLLNSTKKGGNKSVKIDVKKTGIKKKTITDIGDAFKKIKSKTVTLNIKKKGITKKTITDIGSAFKKIKSKTATITIKEKGTSKKTLSSMSKSISKIKGKSVSIKAKASGTKSVSSLQKAIKKVKGKSVHVKSKTSGTSSVKKLHSAIKSVKSKTVHVKAKVSGKGSVNSLKGAIKGLKGKSVHVKAHVSGTKSVNNLANAIARVHDKSVNVTTHKTTIKTTKHKNGSVRIGSPQSITTSNPAKSMSVVTGDPAVAPLVNEAARQMGIGVRDSSDAVDDTRVSEDYWRYMPKQLYTGQKLDTQMSKIEDAITQAGEDINKIIRLNQQKIALDQKQINYQNSLRGSYNAQMSSVLSQLRKYGFHTSGNQITNAGHAASFKGDKASKVDGLLSTYQSVYQSLGEIDTKISNLKTDIWQVKQTIAEQKDQAESNKIEKLQRQLEILTTSIDNSNAIYEKNSSYIGATDYRLKLQMDASQINSASGDVGRFVNEFNKLSVMNFGNPEQAKKINDSLNTLKTSILAQVDTIETLRQEIQDLKISAITEDLNKFTTSLNGNIDKLKNNVQNLQDGLLSGTTFNDLGSSQFGVVDLSQKTGLEQQAQARLDLEKRLNDALDKFAQKNVDQTAEVANAQLRIEQNKYAQLLNLAKQYSQGYLGNVSGAKTSSVSSSRTDAVNIDDSRSTQYLAASKKYAEDMVKARNAYNQALKNARTDEEKEAINQQFILQQIDMQRQVYNEIIKADQNAIATLQNKLNSDELTSDQRQKINDVITNYETEITNSQNSIKEAVKSRFDYENQLITDQINKYKDYADTLSNLASIGKSLNVGKDVLDSLYGGQYDSQYAQYAATLDALSRLRKEQSGFQKGSYEYNLLEAEIKEYESGLSSIVTGLLDVTKSQFENTLDGVQEQIEKAVYGGKTSNENEFENNLWISGVDKELTLEAMRQKIATAQLENETVNKQLQYLDGMQKMSKIESDRLDKEIDVLIAQQKLDAAVGNKNVQTIEKDENGKFQWKYVANQADIDSAQEELNTAKKAYQDFLNQSKADYITRVGEVVSGAKDGSLTPEETKQRLAEINESYKGILSDIPGFDSNTVEGIIDAYNKYVSQNRDVINDYGKDSAISGTQSYQEIIKGFGESFKTVSKDLADIIGNELRSILTGTDNVANNMLRSSTQSDSVTIQQLDITLPNVENGEQFADYMRGFAQVARQSAQGKG